MEFFPCITEANSENIYSSLRVKVHLCTIHICTYLCIIQKMYMLTYVCKWFWMHKIMRCYYLYTYTYKCPKQLIHDNWSIFRYNYEKAVLFLFPSREWGKVATRTLEHHWHTVKSVISTWINWETWR